MPKLRSACAVAVMLAGTAVAASDDDVRSDWTATADLAGSPVARSARASGQWRMGRAGALGVAVGRRLSAWDLFARAEGNYWNEQREDDSLDDVLAVNLAVGAGHEYAGGLLRSSLALGTSLLAIPTDVDDAPSVGLMFDLRPLAFRFQMGDGDTWLGVSPLSLVVAMPVLTGIPLIEIQYRTTLFVERAF